MTATVLTFPNRRDPARDYWRALGEALDRQSRVERPTPKRRRLSKGN